MKDNNINKIIKKLQEGRNRDDKEKIKKAWDFAILAHSGQKRKNGDDFVVHPIKAAEILTNWSLDTTSIIAGLLHDSIEDGGATHKDLEDNFGVEVAALVEGVTKVSNLRLKGSHKDVFVETLRKMILVMAKDLRVVFVKLADRTHNMRTLYALPVAKQKKISRETLEIYAPLAERLGMGAVKVELEDLCFSYLYPEEFKKLTKDSSPYYEKAEKHIELMTQSLVKNFKKEKISADINGRKKHKYSLWKKLQRPEVNGDIANIFDIVALRIIVPEVSDCYAALGIVHSLYKPVPKLGISDFIAQPKPNGYKSIHTKVFGPEGRIVEVQIRTHKMHQQAENGAASHWVYSDAKAKGASDKDLESGKVQVGQKVSWVRELVSWQKELKDSKEFLDAVRFDGFKERNFVFSPKGDVFDLPAGATPIDFAFCVHTKLANYIQAVKVNGKIVPLNYILKSGDLVEILKSKNEKKFHEDWLRFVVTTTARREINKRLNKA